MNIWTIEYKVKSGNVSLVKVMVVVDKSEDAIKRVKGLDNFVSIHSLNKADNCRVIVVS